MADKPTYINQSDMPYVDLDAFIKRYIIKVSANPGAYGYEGTASPVGGLEYEGAFGGDEAMLAKVVEEATQKWNEIYGNIAPPKAIPPPETRELELVTISGAPPLSGRPLTMSATTTAETRSSESSPWEMWDGEGEEPQLGELPEIPVLQNPTPPLGYPTTGSEIETGSGFGIGIIAIAIIAAMAAIK